MAVKTYRVASGADGAFGALVDGVDQTAASRADGWTVAKTQIANFSLFAQGTKQASTAFTPSIQYPTASDFPNSAVKNAFKIPAPLTGTFAGAVWTFTFAVRATVVSSQAGRIDFALWKSALAQPSALADCTKIGGIQTGTTTPTLSTTADVTTVVNYQNGGPTPNPVTLNNEYLFFVIAWETTTQAGSNSADVVIRTGQASSGSRLVTPDFVPDVVKIVRQKQTRSEVAIMRAATR
jgi:hypothetical protein